MSEVLFVALSAAPLGVYLLVQTLLQRNSKQASEAY